MQRLAVSIICASIFFAIMVLGWCEKNGDRLFSVAKAKTVRRPTGPTCRLLKVSSQLSKYLKHTLEIDHELKIEYYGRKVIRIQFECIAYTSGGKKVDTTGLDITLPIAVRLRNGKIGIQRGIQTVPISLRVDARVGNSYYTKCTCYVLKPFKTIQGKRFMGTVPRKPDDDDPDDDHLKDENL